MAAALAITLGGVMAPGVRGAGADLASAPRVASASAARRASSVTGAAKPAGAKGGAPPTLEIWIRGQLRKPAGPTAPAAEGAVSSPSGTSLTPSPRQRVRTLTLEGVDVIEVVRHDAQYQEERRYRGVPLLALLHRYAPPSELDVAILHFANGMAIPLPFRDEEVMKRLDPLIATSSGPAGGTERLARGAFPAISRKDVVADPRPIEFAGNKVVVSERWHPDVPAGRDPSLSPWAHADSLTGIELVAARPYYGQFDVGRDAESRRGLGLFRETCQFCHNVAGVGATYGWDLLAITRDRSYGDSPPHLYHNVAFKPRNASALGLRMPALSFLTEAEAGYLLAWLRSFSAEGPPPGPRPP